MVICPELEFELETKWWQGWLIKNLAGVLLSQRSGLSRNRGYNINIDEYIYIYRERESVCVYIYIPIHLNKLYQWGIPQAHC